jgi:hypothetical protein
VNSSAHVDRIYAYLLALSLAVFLPAASLLAAERFDNPDDPVAIRSEVVDENDHPVAGVEVSAAAPAMGTALWWTQDSHRVRTDGA